MRSVAVDPDPIGIDLVESIAREMGAPVDDIDVPTGLGELTGDGGAGEAAADDQAAGIDGRSDRRQCPTPDTLAAALPAMTARASAATSGSRPYRCLA